MVNDGPFWFVRNLRVPPEHLILAKAHEGVDVLELQRRLYAPMTGIYDAATEQRVRGFQKAAGLPETGVLDIQTAQEIERIHGHK